MTLDVSLSNQNRIATWRKLKAYKGFQLLVEELDKMVAEADKIIFKQGADFEKAYTDRDLAINKRDIAMRLKELPELMISQLGGTGKMPTENPDAYGDEDDFGDEFFNDDF